MEKPFSDIGLRIKEARSAKGWTQQRLADTLNVTVQSVSQWETGRTQPEIDRLIALAGILDVHWDWLKTGEIKNDLKTYYSFGLEKDIMDRLAPIVEVGKIEHHLKFGFSLRPDDLDESTIICRYSAVLNLFAVILDNDDMAPTFKAGDMIICDSGISIRPGDYVFARPWVQDEPIFRRVSSIALNKKESLIATLSAPDEDVEGGEIDMGDEMDRIYGVMVEARRFRSR